MIEVLAVLPARADPAPIVDHKEISKINISRMAEAYKLNKEGKAPVAQKRPALEGHASAPTKKLKKEEEA